MGHIIIGAGPAGVTAAETLSKIVPEKGVTLISGESGPPYARMAIPYLLSGSIDEPGTYIRKDAHHFENLGVRLTEDRVLSVDADKQTVNVASGHTLPYDTLLVATGSSPSAPPINGLDTPGVHACWTLADAREIMQIAQPGSKIVLMGVGFVACIILQGLIELVAKGSNITVIAGPSGRMVRSMMDETAGGMIRRWCEDKGLRVVSGSRVAKIEDGPKVHMGDGEVLDADLVIVATGVKPNTDFLDGTGVEIDEGILIDDYMRTTVPTIFAAGDCAQGYDFTTRERTVHAIQPAAVEHGKAAALNMAGRNVAYKGALPMNVLNTLDLLATSIGRWQGIEGGDRVTLVDEERYKYMRLEFDKDRLIGAINVGRTDQIGVIRGLIQTRVRLGVWKERLRADPHRIMEAYLACTQ